jgi:hypothetical protein
MKQDLFTQRVQLTWIFILVVALAGIGQAFSFTVYQVSIVTMIAAGMGQIAIGNVPPDAPPVRFFRFLAIFVVVIVVVFALSIWMTPYLVNLGR